MQEICLYTQKEISLKNTAKLCRLTSLEMCKVHQVKEHSMTNNFTCVIHNVLKSISCRYVRCVCSHFDFINGLVTVTQSSAHKTQTHAEYFLAACILLAVTTVLCGSLTYRHNRSRWQGDSHNTSIKHHTLVHCYQPCVRPRLENKV